MLGGTCQECRGPLGGARVAARGNRPHAQPSPTGLTVRAKAQAPSKGKLSKG